MIRRVLKIESSSSSQSQEDSESPEQRSSVSLRLMSVAVDDSDNTIVGSYQLQAACKEEDLDKEDLDKEEEGDDVFPSDLPEPPKKFQSPKSATIGRDLSASASALNLSDLERSKIIRRRPPLTRQRPRTAVSVVMPSDYNILKTIRSRSEGTEASQQSEKERMKRQGAMKRRSIIDMDFRTCLLRIYADIEDGWSEVVECTSKLNS